MQAHISSVKALCVSAPNPRSSTQGLLFSAGGRAQLNAWRIYFREGSDGSGRQGCDGGRKSQGARGVGCHGVCVTIPSGEVTERTVGRDDSHTVAGEGKSGGKEPVTTDVVSCHVTSVNQTDDNISTRTPAGATCWHKHLGGHMLLQSGHRHRRKSWKTATCDAGPETRYMSVCVVSPRDLDPSLCPLVHVLTTACSDGYIR